jgi:transposase-like protein
LRLPSWLVELSKSASRLMRKLLKKQGFTPKLLTTDKLGSYGAAFRHRRLFLIRRQSSGGAVECKIDPT